MEYLDEHKGHVLVGGDQPSLLVFDVDSSRIIKQVKLDEGTSVVRKAHNLVACGGVRGQVSLRDPRSFRIEHSFQTHPEGVTSMDLKDHLMITCGLSTRMGRLVVDPMVKVFDIRAMRALAPVAFPMGAFHAKFLPKYSSTACVVSQSGTFQMTDVKGTCVYICVCSSV
jgi:PAB-dependent poly(A)-specific ribonuclease subunit 2